MAGVTLVVYAPVWHGGRLWDDADHLTQPDLRSLAGLGRIWWQLGATQQYYPVVHSAFWLFHRLWGDAPLGYHLVNIGLHATSAFLFVVALKRLGVRGAALAGFIFALHPVQVETVAWMTELKNALSGAFYFAAALAYLSFDNTRRPRLYVAALALFVLAVLSKSVTATLPAGLLAAIWWRRGVVRWTDVRPLVPFFALGAASGILTSWFERTITGAHGAEFDLPAIARPLVAARATWFYLGKIVWPSNLTFIYPRWTMSAANWGQDARLVALVAVLAAAWLMRSRSRAPFAALAFFLVTLAPALGFVNVYPFRFSFVADHFQYLACAGILALVAALVVRGLERAGRAGVRVEAAAVIVFALPLGFLTWRHSREFVDAGTLYRATLAKNPACWLAHNNLAVLLLAGPPPVQDEALAHVQAALALNPDYGEAHNNLGVVWQRRGELERALAEFRAAVRLAPNRRDAYTNLAATLDALGRTDEAIGAYQEVIRQRPGLADAHQKLGTLLVSAGRADAGLAEIREALRLDPGATGAHDTAGAALQRLGRPGEAVAEYTEAIRVRPDDAEAHNNLGTILEGAGRLQDAAHEYGEALKLQPANARVHDNYGYSLWRLGRNDEAVREFREAIRLEPDYAPAHANLGNVLQQAGRLDDAVGEYRLALAHEPSPGRAETHYNLGAALVALGRLDAAAAEFQAALRVNPAFTPAREALAKIGRGPLQVLFQKRPDALP